jgi:hypothetical protein
MTRLIGTNSKDFMSSVGVRWVIFPWTPIGVMPWITCVEHDGNVTLIRFRAAGRTPREEGTKLRGGNNGNKTIKNERELNHKNSITTIFFLKQTIRAFRGNPAKIAIIITISYK